MINHCTVYKKSTGEIVQYSYFDCPDDIEQVARNHYGRLIFFGVEEYDFIDQYSDMLNQYVVIQAGIPTILNKPTLRLRISKTVLIANGEDSVTIRGLPSPCEITFDRGEPEEEVVEITGGSFSFTSENPGRYNLYIEVFPFLPYELEIIAT